MRKRKRERLWAKAAAAALRFRRNSFSNLPLCSSLAACNFRGHGTLRQPRDIAMHGIERRVATVERARRRKGESSLSICQKKKKGEMSPSTFSQKKKNVFFSSRLSFSEFSPYLGTERRADGRSRVGLACREGELDVAGDWGIVFYFEV